MIVTTRVNALFDAIAMDDDDDDDDDDDFPRRSISHRAQPTATVSASPTTPPTRTTLCVPSSSATATACLPACSHHVCRVCVLQRVFSLTSPPKIGADVRIMVLGDLGLVNAESLVAMQALPLVLARVGQRARGRRMLKPAPSTPSFITVRRPMSSTSNRITSARAAAAAAGDFAYDMFQDNATMGDLWLQQVN
jgi:hypothetical protein